jgi:hypothetical protein
MLLSPQHVALLAAHLAKTWPDRHCLACGSLDMGIVNRIHRWPWAQPGIAAAAGEDNGTPVVLLTCQRCGYLMPFHAPTLGLLPDTPAGAG